ncbi:multicopper oxidase family protein [Catenulispora subtropica]|uniref:Multicopper oxidase type 3 n=1 Tax=Catenulispora subtropica TaxID=450798 RepID=A0ABN2T3K5_9ACTN
MTADPPPRPRAPSSRGEPLLAQLARRAVLLVTVLAMVSAAFGAVALASSTGTLNATPSEDSDPYLASGLAFQDPPDADLDAAGGGLTITLDAADMRYELGGGTWAWGQAYDGSSTVPTLRFLPGAQVNVRLVNHLPVATKVHFHGLHMAARSEGEVVCVAPGTSRTYHLAIPAGHPQGTYWYHSHVLATACPSTTDPGSTAGATPGPAPGSTGRPPPASPPGSETGPAPGYAGLSGALIVGDDRASLPVAYRTVATHTFVLQETSADCLVNGQFRPVLAMRPNETQLWRLVNAGMDASYQLRLDGYRFTVVAEDGAPLVAVRTADALSLSPGKRYDVLVTANDHPGDTWLRATMTAGKDEDGDHYPDATLVHVAVAGRAVGRLPPLGG